MPLIALFLFSVGILLVGLLPALPGLATFVPATALAATSACWRRGRPVAALFLGLSWGVYQGHEMLDRQIQPDLERDEFILTGTVVDIPSRNALRSRFTLDVEQCRHLESGRQVPLKRVLLSWYGQFSVDAGEQWQLRVRLRRPRGFVNPGGFDYQAWLLRRGVSATGYIIEGRDNRRLSPRRWNLARVRTELKKNLERAVSLEMLPRLSALTLGETAGLGDRDWQVLRATGTVHLMVVSGLHIGLIAGFFLVPGLFVGRVLNALLPSWISQITAALLAFAAAVGYALLAGFGLPAQRALIMLAVAIVALSAKRNTTPWSALLIAWAGVLVLDPLAGWSAGFWLSFVAVGALLFAFSSVGRSASLWRRLIIAQLAIFAGLFVLQLLLGNPVPLAGPLVNLVAIPWTGFLVLPLALAGQLLSTSFPDAGFLLLRLASLLLQGLWCGLERVAEISDGWQITLAGPGDWLLWGGLLLATLLLLSPGALRLRVMAIIPLSAMLFVPHFSPPLTVVALDVGQGLAVVVHVGDRTLVYDSGPSLGLQLDAGEAVVAPYLSSRGIRAIDKLVLSHGESDHIGGTWSLLTRFPTAEILAGQPDRVSRKLLSRTSLRPCRAGQRWQWDGVLFEILSPDASSIVPGPTGNDNNNNRSCVLMIRKGDVRILLPGDIESPVERKLLADSGLQGPVDLLLAPHHGSKTSSSRAFVNRLKPRHVVFSAGYKHRFGHPYPAVVERYRSVHSRLWNTADQGALIFRWRFDGDSDSGRGSALEVIPWRVEHRRYWF